MSFDDLLADFYDRTDQNEPDDLLESLASPTRYRDLKKITSGGMKTIYKAFDEKSQRYIAYACLNEGLTDVLDEVFINEARLTAKLNHPNIIPIYDVGVDKDSKPFFTMELKSGDSLQDILNELDQENGTYQKQYPLNQLLHIFVKVCDAVAYAHSQKVIHLDLKPENIQVGHYGEVMLCDWGLSKVIEQGNDESDFNQLLLNPDLLNQVSLHGEIKGTPGYMAPEQVDKDGLKTPRTDIFSMGCLLYSILSNKAPFRGDSLDQVIDNTARGEYERLDPKAINKSLVAVCQKAMKTKPEERYINISDLRLDIEKYLEGYATLAENASSWTLLKLFVHRNTWTVLAVLTMVILSLIGGLVFIQKINHEKNIAEKNYLQYKQQQLATDHAISEMIEVNVEKANRIFHLGYQQNALKTHSKTVFDLHSVLEKYPNTPILMSSLGYHYFIQHDFQKSKFYLEQSPGEYSYMLPFLDKYSQLKGERELLELDDFIALLNGINPYKVLHDKMLYVYADKTNDLEKTLKITQALMNKLNPEWDGSSFQYHKKKAHLTLGGKGLTTLGLRSISPLNVLKVNRLTLKDTDVSEFIYKFENLTYLDISGTHIPSLFLRRSELPQLKELVLQVGQYTPKQLRLIPEYIKVTQI